MTIPVLLGSLRPSGNGVGFAEHVIQRCKSLQLEAALASSMLPSGVSLPTGPVLSPLIAAGITDSSQYDSEEVRAWSRLVSQSKAIIILTPQYNWGIPGPLKNTLDHIYYEWRGKPILLITYGGHGGGKCAEQLKSVLEGGLKAVLVTDPFSITLPPSFIRGSDRVDPSNSDQATFRAQYEAGLDDAITKLKENIID